MAHSLEVREPLMDHQLVEWLATLPSSLKMHAAGRQVPAQEGDGAALPDDVLYRPKMGFAVPLARWFRGPLRQRVRDSAAGRPDAGRGWFNPDVVRSIWSSSTRGGTHDHSTPLWTLLMFDAFLRGESGAMPRQLRRLSRGRLIPSPTADCQPILNERVSIP